MKRLYCFAVVFLILLSTLPVPAQVSLPGTIEGRVYDQETSRPLPGANLRLGATLRGAMTDSAGRFLLKDVPAGSYTIQASLLGYRNTMKADVIVGAGRSTQLTIALAESPLEEKEVVVTAGYFTAGADEPVSAIRFASEEVRRAPGSAGDVSRIILGLPSLAKVNDQSNSLIVRGGSPLENAFFVDGIEIPNINHFPTQGATGGPIGIIDAALLEDVTFSAGGFSAAWGDRLSSVMDLRLRSGSTSGRQSQLDLNFAGFGGMTEGPLSQDGKSSYLVSVRRSYLDLLVKAIDIGTSVAPSYGDCVAKAVIELAPGHTLTLLDIFSDDHNDPDRKTAIENDMVYYGTQDIYLNTAGLTWRALWSPNVFSLSALSYTRSDFSEEFFETGSGSHLVRNRSQEGTLTFASSLHYRIDAVHSLEIGIQAQRLSSDYDNFYDAYTDALGQTSPAFLFDRALEGWKLGSYLTYTVHPLPEWSVTAGIRLDHFSSNRSTTVAPRINSSYEIGNRLTFKASAGMYYQTLPMLLLSQHEANTQMKNPEALQLIAGLDYLLSDDTKLGIECYSKRYQSFPIDPAQQSLFLVDELFYRYGFFFAHGALQDKGRASSEGIEVLVQKKLSEKLYGLAGASVFRSRYRDGLGVWRSRAFDNRWLVSAEGGYRPDGAWEFSGRWIAAGGVPFTPFDADRSAALGREVLDESKINGRRLPAYHCLNLRVDRRWHFESTNLVAYFSIWNVYNERNISGYFWSAQEQKEKPILQWGLLPIFGVKYEF
ncbi:MAG: TonB-dependent receptor [Acidobacteriota bacterium]